MSLDFRVRVLRTGSPNSIPGSRQPSKKSTWGDRHSIEDAFVTGFRVEDKPRDVTITFIINSAPRDVRGPTVDARLVGVFPTIRQTIEDRYGKKITVDRDMFGERRRKKIAGPLAVMEDGEVTITWPPEKKK